MLAVSFLRLASSLAPSYQAPLPLSDYVKEKRRSVSFLLHATVIDQSPRERTGVQKQQEQRERSRRCTAVARVSVLHRRWMLSCNMQ